MTILTREFYQRPAVEVARALLGCHLVRQVNGGRMVGLIGETEAYQGEEDQGCHARVGRTARTKIMYGPAGHAYIYFTYGMHWLLNAITGAEGEPAAVLIRAILPLEGQAMMATYRPNLAHQAGWLNGPAKLTQAMHVDGKLNGIDLCRQDGDLLIEHGVAVSDALITTGPRVGLNNVPEPWRSIHWRFLADLGQGRH